ncbi:hypothetical protein AMJ57_03365 [Parcubacteria bacterium SG8_24]|nr:MAG: hypothetical protein AMJ57_03365 [Parcubacteria bacterium SG8_24]
MAKPKKTVYLGSDHAGFRLKEAIKAYLKKGGYQVVDLGTDDDRPSDYPDFVIPAARRAARSGKGGAAIVFGGSGIGECIAANKVPGVRAALVYDTYTARMSRQHNDANVLCLGGRTATGDERLAKRLVKLWLETGFSGAVRHKRRIDKLHRAERSGRRLASRRGRKPTARRGAS